MCGIFGSYSNLLNPKEIDSLMRARDTLSHRGPDSSGYWICPEHKLFLSHRRLAIIDLSSAGQQPMHSSSGRFTIVFNGEIYNFKELMPELAQHSQLPQDCGDTAVMLAAFEAYGVEKAISKFCGMFAFALWDAKEQSLTLARDRAGEKPLYYGWSAGKFLFSSEPRAFAAALSEGLELNYSALGHFTRFGYIPSPLSVYRNFYKLPAATFMQFSRKELAFKPENFSEYTSGSNFSPRKFWSPFKKVEPTITSENDNINKLEVLLKNSVSRQMISDVPLGAFLSGGIDSSLIVALMQSIATKPVRTFSIGFSSESFDEAPYAKAVAKHLGTEHTEMYVSEDDALKVIPDLPSIFSEPFADSSQIPTFLVSKLTRQFVTVSLSGDGGDELFGGYERYVWTKRLWKSLALMPNPAKSSLALLANSLPTIFIDRLISSINPMLPSSFRLSNAGSKIQRALSIGSVKSPEELYLIFLSQKHRQETTIPKFTPSQTALDSVANWREFSDLYNKLMWMDFENYLPDDILVKVDRSSMAVSLESRAPFLDHSLIEFAFSLPIDLKIKAGNRKYILKKLLERYVPRTLTDRPKMGFGAPISSWIKGKLRPWAEDLLSQESLESSGFLNSALIRQVWNLHLKGNHSNQYFLWHILMLQAWLKEHKNSVSL